MLTTSEQEQLNNCSVDDLLDSLSLDMMADNIQSQIDDGLSTRNYLAIVSDKFEIIREGEFDTETKDTIQQEINQFYLNVISQITEKYDLMFDDTYTDVQEIAETLYDFFVLNGKRNTKEFIEQYVEENIKTIAEYIGDSSNSSMATTMLETAQDKEHMAVAANIGTVIDYIIDMHIDTDTFLDTLASGGDYCISKIQEYIQNDIINGDIPTEYMKRILDEYDSAYASELRNEFRLHFGMKGVGLE